MGPWGIWPDWFDHCERAPLPPPPDDGAREGRARFAAIRDRKGGTE